MEIIIYCILVIVYTVYINDKIKKSRLKMTQEMRAYVYTHHLELNKLLKEGIENIKENAKPRGRSSKKRRKVSKRSVS